MDLYRHLLMRGRIRPITFGLVHLSSVIFTLLVLVTAYSSSTYMERFVSAEAVGLIYAVGAFLAIIITLTLPRLLRRAGNVITILLLTTGITISLIMLGGSYNTWLTVTAFTIFLALIPQIYLNLDIFLETLIGNQEETTGRQRGLILTLMSTAAFFAPVIMGYVVGTEEHLERVYYFSAVICLLFIAMILSRFRHFLDPEYETVRVRDMIRDALLSKDIRTVLITQFLLQFFYTWAVIYIPLYLAKSVGFDWVTISQVLAVGLLAFVIFEYPIGRLADRHWGEKEMMAVGFVILALTMSSTSFIVSYGATAWMILMFISRIGASLVEVTTESYFFKKVTGEQSTLISFFRLMRPLANFLGAVAGSLALYFFPFNFIFIVLALFMASGVFFTLFLTDTK